MLQGEYSDPSGEISLSYMDTHGGLLYSPITKPYIAGWLINSFLASCDFCHLLIITFANSLNSDQDRQNVGPDQDPNRLTLSYCP